MSVSGIVLFAAPKCRDARLAGWECLGWDRQAWADVHITGCALFVVLGAAHVFYNRRVLWGYVYSKRRKDINLWKELLVGMALTGVVLVGTFRGWPPMSMLTRWRQEWKYQYSTPAPQGRDGGASRNRSGFGRENHDTGATRDRDNASRRLPGP